MDGHLSNLINSSMYEDRMFLNFSLGDETNNAWWSIRRIAFLSVISSLTFIGLIGNIISCTVIITYLLKTSGTYVLFLFLSASDTCTIIMLTIEALINSFDAKYYLLNTNFQCKSFRFFWYFFLQLSAWVTAALTVERYVTLRYFHIVYDRHTILKRAWLAASLIMLVVGLVNCHLFFTSGMLQTNFMESSCNFITNTKNTIQAVTNGLHLFFYGLIPYSVTLTFNILLIIRIRKTQQKSRGRTTFMLLVVTFSFIGLTLPYMINHIIVNHTSLNVFSFTRYYTILAEGCRYLLFINSSCNFMFYMTGKQFRRATKTLLCRKEYHGNRRRSTRFASIFTGNHI